MPLQAGRRIRAQAPFLAVLGVLLVAVGYLIVEPEHWRRGIGILSASLLLAGVLRLALDRPHAGLLAFRNRVFDALCYLVLGVVILVVDIRLPH
jgi:GNAT superfamily N-acetyltransferase